MDAHEAALLIAGIIGCGVAVLHGVLLQRMTVRPLDAILAKDGSRIAPIRRLIGPLLHFTTFNWFASGLALIAAALCLGHEARIAIALLAGSSFLFGAIGNFRAVRRPHPGWILYGTAVVLIAYGIAGPR